MGVFFVICNYFFKFIQGSIAKELYSFLFYLFEFFPVRLFYDISLLAVAAGTPITRHPHPDPVVRHSRSRFLGFTRSSAPLIQTPPGFDLGDSWMLNAAPFEYDIELRPCEARALAPADCAILRYTKWPDHRSGTAPQDLPRMSKEL